MKMEIQAFVLSKDGEVIEVYNDLEDAKEEGSRVYLLDTMLDSEIEDEFDVVPASWSQESDDTWVLWSEQHEYTITVR